MLKRILRVSAISLLFAFTPVGQAAPFSDEQKQAIETIIHDYLVGHPKVMVEMAQSLQDQRMAEMSERAKTAAIKLQNKLFSSKYSPVLGSTDASLTLVEFLDYQCPHCKEMAETIDNLIADNTKLRVIVKVMPIFGPASELSAKAMIAAHRQDRNKYLAFHKALLAEKTRLDTNKIYAAAEKVGLDLIQLKKDIGAADTIAALKADVEMAQQIGIMGTPAFLVADTAKLDPKRIEYIPGAAMQADLQRSIDKVSRATD